MKRIISNAKRKQLREQKKTPLFLQKEYMIRQQADQVKYGDELNYRDGLPQSVREADKKRRAELRDWEKKRAQDLDDSDQVDQEDDDAEVEEEKVDRRKFNKGGPRPGAGRPKGSKTSVDVKLDNYINQVINKGGPVESAKDLFTRIYKDPKVPAAIRRACAKQTMPYEDPKFKSSELVKDGGSVERRISNARETLESKLLQVASTELEEKVSKRLN